MVREKKKKKDKIEKIFKAKLWHIHVLEQNPNQIQSVSQTTQLMKPDFLCICALGASSPGTQLHIPRDCTSSIMKPIPTVFPAILLSRHYLHSAPLTLTTVSASGIHCFFIKKVLTDQPMSACQLPSGRLNRTAHCWAHPAASPSLGAQIPVSFLLPFLFIWVSQNLFGNLTSGISAFLLNFKPSSAPTSRIIRGCTCGATAETISRQHPNY